MRSWMPISTSPKARLALAAVTAFGAASFDEVAVADLAAQAEVTTGALYHHFGSKLGLYSFVRDDVEGRLVDRIKGALAAGAGVSSALVVGLDFAVGEGYLHLLDVPPPPGHQDKLTEALRPSVSNTTGVLASLLAAALRAAIAAVGSGVAPNEARAALRQLRVQPPDLL